MLNYIIRRLTAVIPLLLGIIIVSFIIIHLAPGEPTTVEQALNPKVSSQTFRDVDGLTVSVDVTNTGKMAGKEVVQVYVHDHKSRLVRPPKELKGFAKVELQPGETKKVTLALDFRAFAYYHPAYKQWVAEDGEFDILIGASSTDIRCVQTVTLQSTQELPCLLNPRSTLREWMADPRGKRILGSFIQKLPTQVQTEFGRIESDVIGMDATSFFMDMPLSDRLYFLNTALPILPEEMVDELLTKVYSIA